MEGQNQKIEEKIKSIGQIANIKYQRPVNRNEEYVKNLFQNKDALLYLVKERGFTLDTIKHFQLGLTEKNRLSIPIYKNGSLINYKFRTLPPEEKGFFRTLNSETYIFNGDEGLKVAREKGEIIVVEGEIDAITLWQNGFKNIISLVGGCNHIGPWIKELEDIPKIFINLDADDSGQKAARKLAEHIGLEKCYNVVLPVKDANDFFKKYMAENFENLLSNARKFPIEDVLTLGDFIDEVRENRNQNKDFKFGYPQLDKITGGFNRKNLIILSAYSGHGKSSYAYNLCINFCDQNNPVLYIPLEDDPKYSAKRMLNIFSKIEISQIPEYQWDALKKDVIKFPLYIYVGQDKLNIEIFKKIIETGKKLYNIEIFVLDHIDFLVKRSKNQIEEVGFLMRELIDICRNNNVALIIIAHVRKRQDEKGKSYNIEKMPSMDDLKGSSFLYQDAHMVLMLLQKREIEKDLVTDQIIKEKVFLNLAVQKNREGYTTFEDKPIQFDFDVYSGLIEEHIDEEQPENKSMV